MDKNLLEAKKDLELVIDDGSKESYIMDGCCELECAWPTTPGLYTMNTGSDSNTEPMTFVHPRSLTQEWIHRLPKDRSSCNLSRSHNNR